MRLWVHDIWLIGNPEHPLCTLPPDEKKIEEKIQQHGERQAATAWALYVFEEPPKYYLDADYEEGITLKDITRFPLAAFLKAGIVEGYVAAASVSDLRHLPGEIRKLLASLPGQP